MKDYEYTPERAKRKHLKMYQKSQGLEDAPIVVEAVPEMELIIPTSMDFLVYHFLQEKEQELLHKLDEKGGR